jgi:GNAT superfamily N-acetyltransferase
VEKQHTKDRAGAEALRPLDAALELRQLRAGDAAALAAFYNGLSPDSKRTFRPLGAVTTATACEGIIQHNKPDSGEKLDLVAVSGDAIVGWSFVWGMRADRPTFGLAVADMHHGQGLASRLMDGVLDAARARGKTRIQLTVVQDNEKAWRMYERRGFVKSGEHTGSDGLAYFSMTADLS